MLEMFGRGLRTEHKSFVEHAGVLAAPLVRNFDHRVWCVVHGEEFRSRCLEERPGWQLAVSEL